MGLLQEAAQAIGRAIFGKRGGAGGGCGGGGGGGGGDGGDGGGDDTAEGSAANPFSPGGACSGRQDMQAAVNRMSQSENAEAFLPQVNIG